MLIRYKVLQLLDAARGSLVEFRIVQADAEEPAGAHWLWIEGNTATSLKVIGNNASASRRAFDYAALVLDGQQGELCWANGHRDHLVDNPSRQLHPAHHNLLLQHLN